MKRQKGFTLVELIATLGILTLILVIALPIVDKIMIGAEEDVDELSMEMIEGAAGMAAGVSKLGRAVPVQYLADKGFIEKDKLNTEKALNGTAVKNPETGLFDYVDARPNLAYQYLFYSAPHVSHEIDLSNYSKTGEIIFDATINYAGVSINTSELEVGKSYTMSYKYQKLGGTLMGMGGHTDTGWGDHKVYADGVLTSRKYPAFQSGFVADDTKVHNVIVVFNSIEEASTAQRVYIQPNRGYVTPVKVRVWDWKLEEGTNRTWPVPASAKRTH